MASHQEAAHSSHLRLVLTPHIHTHAQVHGALLSSALPSMAMQPEKREAIVAVALSSAASALRSSLTDMTAAVPKEEGGEDGGEDDEGGGGGGAGSGRGAKGGKGGKASKGGKDDKDKDKEKDGGSKQPPSKLSSLLKKTIASDASAQVALQVALPTSVKLLPSEAILPGTGCDAAELLRMQVCARH